MIDLLAITFFALPSLIACFIMISDMKVHKE